ncbi:MAG: ferric reductase-like transmembrane domain-containing protein [Kofleriaceae bacterium]
MPTSERLVTVGFAKVLLVVNALVPAALLVWGAQAGTLGVNPVSYALHTTGLLALLALISSLAITPLRRLTGWSRLIAVRRALGLLAFGYVLAHLGIYFVLDRELDVGGLLAEIWARQYLLIGAIGVLAMVPLAITSTDGMVARLGGRRWKLLHRLAYVAAGAGVVHFYLLVKSDVSRPRVFAIVLVGLLGYRAVAHYVDLRRAARRPPAPRLAGATRPRFWSGRLRVAAIFDESADVRTFRLTAEDGGPLPFDYQAGQYLNLVLIIGEHRVRRSYTIASSPTRRDYCEVTIKRKADGWVSGHLHDTLAVGSTLQVAAPAGRFVFAGDADVPRIVLLAGGVGITPMMSMIRSLTDRAWPGHIHLLYAVRTGGDVVFAEELRYLAARFPNLHVCVTISGDDDAWTGDRGYISAELLRREVPELTSAPIWLCGPQPMMDAVTDPARARGCPRRGSTPRRSCRRRPSSRAPPRPRRPRSTTPAGSPPSSSGAPASASSCRWSPRSSTAPSRPASTCPTSVAPASAASARRGAVGG